MSGLAGYSDISQENSFFSLAGCPSGDWFARRVYLREASCTKLEQAVAETSPEQARRLTSWVRDDYPKWPGSKYSAYFKELDAWTEYWDIYHPETRGRYYFGDGDSPGLLATFLPTPMCYRNPVFDSWKSLALYSDETVEAGAWERFETEARKPHVVDAVLEVDALVLRLMREHFADDSGVVDDFAYLDAMERFGKDTLPACPERYARIPDGDGRKSTSLHHTIEGHVMWFGWAVHLICAQMSAPRDPEADALRRLLLAGAALGCAFDFAHRKRCHTRSAYMGESGRANIWRQAQRGLADFEASAQEMRQ